MNILYPSYPAPRSQMALRDVAGITDWIIHHTAGSLTQTALDIDQEHRNIGDAEIGYNYVITPDGNVYQGRLARFVPAAAYGRNTQSLNVSLVGNFQHDDPGYTGPPTAMQIKSLEELTVYAHVTFPSIERTIGHRDVATLFYSSDPGDYATACPGDELYALIPAIKQYVNQQVHAKR